MLGMFRGRDRKPKNEAPAEVTPEQAGGEAGQ
jgi:hypothetical protein